MDFNDTTTEAAFRATARDWLQGHAPAHEVSPTVALSDAEEVARGRAWQACLASAGYAGITLPTALGGAGGTIGEAVIFAEEEARYRLPKGPYIGIGQGMALAAIINHGSPEQIAKFVRPTLHGELTWCQLFSEPAAGSDLAAVRTRAAEDADGWVVNGQKVWSSWAHEADWGLLLARSDPSVPKHRGLTFFLVDMKSPGVAVRPIHQISGASDFNETFLTDLRLADTCRVGAVGEGWRVAMTVLGSERLNAGTEEPTCSVDQLIALAAATPRGAGTALDSSAVRLTLATGYAREQAERHFQARVRTMVSRGDDPGALPAMIKLSFAGRLQQLSGFMLELREMAGLAGGPDDEATRLVDEDYIWSVAMRLAGGADEVLRNQLAERVLGMPGDVRTDKTAPFSSLA